MQWRERRLRIRRREDVPPGQARMHPDTMKELNIEDRVEVVIGGKKRLTFTVLGLDAVPRNEVWCNADDLRMFGVADNTIATVRRPLTGG